MRLAGCLQQQTPTPIRSCQHSQLDQNREKHDRRMELALTMTAIEEQYVLEEYDTTLDLFSDYQEMVIQFG